MNILLNKWLMIVINLALTTILFFLLAPAYDLFHYINQLFYISYFYLFVGLLMLVIRGGFFDAITYSFRRFHGMTSKRRDYMDDWKTKPLPSQSINRSWLNFFIFHGVTLTLGLLGLLAIYYHA
ncbi:DUF3899 domain-containing protein [Halobacillus salinarum]|uniref:DUF3899 domain-containing protein n=1 Tax=Halobacillus salinarum TaxID=2932257 RepID=A0ABY4EH90_9BACI|nr:DUF3899 domain-containing protein [Halobacillus salinarum]UOQ43437.1 DUF3899 domain-containing protein [Halobacillus salinarum]